jgi:iron-regulated transporter 1
LLIQKQLEPEPTPAPASAVEGEREPELKFAAIATSVPTRMWLWLQTSTTASVQGLRAYVHHPVFLASLGYCLLYISCLSFGGIMVAYLKALGVTDAWLAAGRAIAALVGVCATAATPVMIKRMGLLRTGMLAVLSQTACLVPLLIGLIVMGGASDDSAPAPASFVALVFITICSSRFGLWSFDLVETQLMQEMVEAADVGRINGAQEAFTNIGYLFSFVLTSIFADPMQFVYPAAVSVGAVAGCAVCFAVFQARRSALVSTLAGLHDQEQPPAEAQAPPPETAHS